MNEDEEYVFGLVLGILSILIPFVWTVGYAELVLKLKYGGTAKSRYDNRLFAGWMRGLELWATLLTAMFGTAVLLIVVALLL